MGGVAFDGVTKIYPDGTCAVSDLNLQIADGEFVILVGPSGCGKSTALRMVAGLEEISSGSVSIDGRVVNDLSPKMRDIAMVFQSYALYPHMTVADNMGFALRLAKVDRSEVEQRVARAASILGLVDHVRRKPKALSGGQRQRVAMGRAIVRSPQVFLMDEPLSNLDAKLRVQMRAEIASLQQQLGVTAVYVTHDQVEAMTMGDRVAVLRDGVLQQVDAPQVLYDRPDNLFVAAFIGSPAMNTAEVTLRRDDGRFYVDLDDGTSLNVPDAALARYPDAAEHAGGRVAVGIRPEHFAPPEDVGPGQVWPGRKVTLVEMLGSEMLVHFEANVNSVTPPEALQPATDPGSDESTPPSVPGQSAFTARFPPSRPPAVGQELPIGCRTEHLHFFDVQSGRALR